tara:strand:- start:132 stop:254 length:123 start_codon:yes stop_codon:yes gene_type:complete
MASIWFSNGNPKNLILKANHGKEKPVALKNKISDVEEKTK